MVTRRSVLQGPAFGGLLASLAPEAEAAAAEAAPAQAQRTEEAAIQEVSNSVRTLRDELKRQNDFWELASLREPIRTFLRSTGKFPDFLEVGIDVWQQVYDWHIRYHLAPALGRDPVGRYTIMLMATTLVMRVDTPLNFVGVPYDNR
jgi:hypothetical protein